MKKIKDLTAFFVAKSPVYMTGASRRYYYSFYLVAYFRFMYYSLKV